MAKIIHFLLFFHLLLPLLIRTCMRVCAGVVIPLIQFSINRHFMPGPYTLPIVFATKRVQICVCVCVCAYMTIFMFSSVCVQDNNVWFVALACVLYKRMFTAYRVKQLRIVLPLFRTLQRPVRIHQNGLTYAIKPFKDFVLENALGKSMKVVKAECSGHMLFNVIATLYVL